MALTVGEWGCLHSTSSSTSSLPFPLFHFSSHSSLPSSFYIHFFFFTFFHFVSFHYLSFPSFSIFSFPSFLPSLSSHSFLLSSVNATFHFPCIPFIFLHLFPFPLFFPSFPFPLIHSSLFSSLS